MDSAFGSAVEITDACLGATKSHSTTTAAAMTPVGTPANFERVEIQF